MIQKIIVLNIIVYKNQATGEKRFLSFSLSKKKKSVVDYFVLPFLHESQSKPLPFNWLSSNLLFHLNTHIKS